MIRFWLWEAPGLSILLAGEIRFLETGFFWSWRQEPSPEHRFWVMDSQEQAVVSITYEVGRKFLARGHTAPITSKVMILIYHCILPTA